MPDNSSLGFIHGDLDRFAHKRTDPGWLQQESSNPASRFIGFTADKVMLDFEDGPALADATARKLHNGQELIFLGRKDDRSIFAFQIDDSEFDPAPAKAVDLRSTAIQGLLPAAELGWLAQARSLLHWHSSHRFCAVCGSRTKIVDGGYRRSCESCGAGHFPRTDPVAIVIVTRGDKLLLGRGHHFIENMYSTLAGFVEPGETLEDAARREIFEESGILIGKIIIHSNQPWPFPANLMVGMIGEGLNDDIKMDEEELADCRWFSRAEVKQMFAGTHPEGLLCPPGIAIAHHLIKAVLED